jgi:MFS family permease
MSSKVSPPPTTLHRRWLFLARTAWVMLAITALAIVVFSVPSSFEHYRSVCTAASEVCSERAVDQPTPEGVQAFQDAGLSVRTYALLNVVLDKVYQLVWFAVGALIFWRRSDDLMALLVSAFLVSFGPVAVDITDAEALISSQLAWSLPVLGVNIVGNVCAVLFFLLFPSGRFAPHWMRWLAVAFCVYQVTSILVPELYSLLAFLGIVVSLVWSQIYSYRKFSSPEQRRQTKWVVFGTTLAVAGTFPFQLPVDLSLVGGDTPLALLLLRTGFAFSFLLVPLSISVAVLRSHLFDIDVLINRTLVYGSLTAMLIGLYLGGIVVLQWVFVSLTGEKSTLAVVASTLLIAALFNPLRRRIQSFIDRGFYRKKYDARKTLESFSAKLRDETNLDALSDDLVAVVRETMQPEHVTLWLRPDTAPRDRQVD